MEAEKKAAEIIAEAEDKAAEIKNKINTEISEKINSLKEQEQLRFNEIIKNAERQNSNTIAKAINLHPDTDIDYNAVADQILQRVMKTVFD